MVPATPTAPSTSRLGEQDVDGGDAGVDLLGRRRVGLQEALGHAHAADVEAAVPAVRDQLGRAAADVDDQVARAEPARGGDAAADELGLLVSGEQPRDEAVAPLDLAEEGLAVLRVADAAGGDEEGALCAELLGRAAVVDERVADAGDRDGEEAPSPIDAFAEPRDREAPLDLVHAAVDHVGHEQPRGVRPQVERCDSHASPCAERRP